MSPFPTRERKPASPSTPAEIVKTHEAVRTASEFQPESGALAPCEPIDDQQLDHDRRDDL
jgi:hypothetical protein